MLGKKGRGPRKAGGFLLAVATSALLFAWFTGVASAAVANGTLEICKFGANGTNVAGSPFTFTVQKGQNPSQQVVVTAPQCSNTSLPPGTYTLTENLTSNGLVYTQVDATTQPDSAFVSENPLTAKTKVIVSAGLDTIVNVTNTLAATTVKVCKTSTAFPGQQYSFTIAGVPVTAIANGDCSQVVGIQAGSVITVAEQVPTGEVATVAITQGTGQVKRNLGSSIRFVVSNGINVVTFDDEPLGPPQNGLLEICKDAGDPFISGSYHFSIADGSQTYQADVAVGQCTTPINIQNGGIPAGTVTITETIPANTSLDSVFLGLNSAGALGTVNKANGTAVVVVPIASAGDVQVHFVNVSNITQLKVCKFLPAGSEALRNVTFTFDVKDDAFPDGTVFTVTVTVPTGASSACTIVMENGIPVPFPIGSKVTVTERNNRPFVDAGSGLGNPDTEKQTITSGINEIDFTNTAFGQLEICKYMVDSDPGDKYGWQADPSFGQTFTFNYVNTADKTIKGTVTTTAGSCSFPQPVPAGTYTVTEDLSKLFVKMNDYTKVPAFMFVDSDARGPFGDSRCVPPQPGPAPDPSSSPTGPGCGNPATVTVPYFNPNDPSTGETQVAFFNRALRASVKICKIVSSDSTATLANTTWTFTVSTTSDGTITTTAGPLKNGQCTGNIGSYTVATQGSNNTLAPNTVTVSENGVPSLIWKVTGISVAGGYDVCFAGAVTVGCNTTDPSGGVVSYHTGPGPVVVQFTNTAKPAVPAGG